MAFDKLKARSEGGGGSNAVNFANFVLRALQFLIGVVILIMYATQPSYSGWRIVESELKFGLGIAAGALAVAITPFLALLPFFFGYKPVAFACLWDVVVMAVNAAAFAYYKARFPYGSEGDVERAYIHSTLHISYGRYDVMRAAVTVDLVGMLLWLITLLMAIGLLFFGRLRGRNPRQ